MDATAIAPGRRVVHQIHCRVYWEDTDAGGVVYYANYLRFFERARTEWLRARGVAQAALKDEVGALFVVAAAQLEYRQPARLDDLLAVDVAVADAGRASLTLDQQARCQGRLLVQGKVRIGCVDAHTLRPRRIPEAVLDTLR